MWKSSFFCIFVSADSRRTAAPINISRKAMTRYAVIVAGGSGSRFGSATPKQFLPLAGKPVLMHTIERFAGCGAEILLVLPAAQFDYWESLCREYDFHAPVTLVEGGATRFHSVKNALDRIQASGQDIVAVHDGVRPLVPEKVIEEAYECARKNGSAIPVVSVSDSIRKVDKCSGASKALRRDELAAVQTPQTFLATELKQAYSVEYSDFFTDDASVYENSGHSVTLIDGDVDNIKITHPKDIAIAETLMKFKDGTAR